jgi:S1-C subfamily serine protease
MVGIRINLLTVIFIGMVCLIFGCAAATKFTSEPDGASIYLNRVFIGTTPFSYNVKDIFGMGSVYGFTAEKAGYRPDIRIFREIGFDDARATIPPHFHFILQPLTVEKSSRSSMGIGTSWPITLGYVVTNHHIIEGHNKITLICPDGKKIPATIFVDDKINDIVLLKVANPRELPPALPISLVKPGIGAKVFTIGYPHPDILGNKPKLTDGLISSVTGFQDDPRTYQITVPLQAGNSGGPLINLNGEVIGIVAAKLDAVAVFKWSGDLPQNVNYAIKVNYLKALLESVSGESTQITELPRNPNSVEELAARIENSIMIVLAE